MLISVYITFPNKTEAIELANALLENKLLFCCNIIKDVTSIYEWEGDIFEENEVVLIAKTKKELFSSIEKMVKEKHSYENPCIIYHEIAGGSLEFLNWLSR